MRKTGSRQTGIRAPINLLLCSILILGINGAATAEPGTTDKRFALGAQAGVTFQYDEDEDKNGPYDGNLNYFQVNGSYLPNPVLEARFGASAIEDVSGYDYFLLLGLQVNFNTDRSLVPFIGASWESQFTDDGDDSDWLAVFAGARFFLNSNVAFRPELAYHTTTETNHADVQGVRVSLGLEWLF